MTIYSKRINISDKNSMVEYFNAIAKSRDFWKKKNKYYYNSIDKILKYHVPSGSSVLEIGCGTGDLLNALNPSRGVGIDISANMVDIASSKYPNLEFRVGDMEDINIYEKFDYVIISDVIGYIFDIQGAFEQIKKVTTPKTRIIITYFNYLWEPLLRIGETLNLKMREPMHNWLSLHDIGNLLYISGYEVIRKNYKMLFPINIPIVSTLCNKILANFPLLWKMSLVQLIVAKEIGVPYGEGELSCSVIIPCKNESGNIENAVRRTPNLGKHTELIFVEGNSSDNTLVEIQRVINTYPDKTIRLVLQGEGKGKGDAVRRGFAVAKGEILIILDADLTVPPEDLKKFFMALIEGKGEFINGSRLVYQMESGAMRILNVLGNKFFSRAFTYLLEQRFKDTLCGTKALFKVDYDKIAAGRIYFGDFDPFGDFDLIFGASKLNLKIIEIPIRYKSRTYGSTQISRFQHGWLLIKMCYFAIRKIKFV